MTTFTNVFYEPTFEKANQRLRTLRAKDNKHSEIKAYIVQEGDKYRVFRRVELLLNTETSDNTFTSVFYEDSEEAAAARLFIMRFDGLKELKAYIVKKGKKFRVLRKVQLP